MIPRLPQSRRLRTPLLLLVFALAAPLGAVEPSSHPLDPLSQPEIAAAAGAVRKDSRFPEDGRFAQIALLEPPKAAVLAWEKSAAPVPREALVVLYSRVQDKTWETTVDLTKAPRIRSWNHVAGAQAAVLDEEEDRVAELVLENEAWVAALKRRGIDPEEVVVDVWAYGPTEAERPRSRRALPFVQGDAANYYSRPVEGLEAIIDLVAETVEVIDEWQGEPLPRETPDFNEDWIGRAYGLRDAPKPLQIVQPQGPDFTLQGQEVRWQNWRFRWQMHPRLGLVLHQVRYFDKNARKPGERSVLYRGSLSEMAVPYGDPKPRWAWRSAFDVGEYQIGRLTAPLRRGLDVPENAVLFNAFDNDDYGRPRLLRDVVALYERDGGLLWRHGEDARRGRDLVLFFLATVGNYDYGVSWIFKQDGTIEVETGMTGIMLTKAVKDGHHDPSSHLVAPNVAAVHHQHILSFRLDLDVDGPVNSVYSMNSYSKDPEPPYFNTMVMEETVFERERAACQNMDMATARSWRIGSPKTKNELGHETGYILVPGANSLPLLDPRAPNRQRGRFMDCHLWVTQYAPRELYAAGDYPNQSGGGKGLPEWTQADRKIREEDVVVWYTLNATHIPRPEEWPVMNTTRYGFKLIPAGFFPRNPALDVPVGK